jgi:hypothetical protein
MPKMVWFYSIPIVVVFVVGVLAGTFRRSRGPVHCSSCVTPMSARRRSLFRLPFGGWVCPHCGTQMDRSGRGVSGPEGERRVII